MQLRSISSVMSGKVGTGEALCGEALGGVAGGAANGDCDGVTESAEDAEFGFDIIKAFLR
jgi:hypothetical protein